MGKHVSNDSTNTGETTKIETDMDAVHASTTDATSPAPTLTNDAIAADAAAGMTDTTAEPGAPASASDVAAADVAAVSASEAAASQSATNSAEPTAAAATTAAANPGDAVVVDETIPYSDSANTDNADRAAGHAAADTDDGAVAVEPLAPTLGRPGPTIVPERNVVLEGPGARRTRPAPPPRPEFSLETPAPVLVDVPRTAPIKVARVLWLVSFALGTAALLFAGLGDGPRRTALEAVVTELATDQSAEVLTALTNIVFWSSFGALLAVTVIELFVVLAMLRGRGGARWALLVIVLALHLGVALLADAFVAVDEGGLMITILVIAQWIVAAAAVTASLLPGATDWFRAKRKARLNPVA